MADGQPRQHQPAESGRSEIWLALLRRMSEAVPRWMVYKGTDSAFTGTGDIDSVAPHEDWGRVTELFHQWAVEEGLGTMVVCDHVPNVRHLIALDPGSEHFFEMDVNCRKIFLGSTLFNPEQLLTLSVEDERGFRRLRPGVEGLMKLVQNGARRGGRPNWSGIRTKGIAELLAADPEGVEVGACLFRRGAGPVRRLASAVVDGHWDALAMLEVEAACMWRAVFEPDAVVMRLRFRRVKAACPLLRTVFDGGRSVGPDPDGWLAEVTPGHRVLPTSGAAGT